MQTNHAVLRTLFALTLAALLTACGDNTPQQSTAADAPTRPKFELPDLEGKLRSIGEWDGEVILLNFWAPWCPPCREEMPAFMELHDQYGGRGLAVVGVTIDTVENAQTFIDTLGVEYPILIGEERGIAISRDYGNKVGALPYTVIIDRNGRIRESHRNAISYTEAEKAILPLL